jgi:hypothetical protein
MVRTQIQLTDEQAKMLKRLAADRDVSMAELIRQSINVFFRSVETTNPEERKRRAMSAVGMFQSREGDISVEHDKYLAEDFAR